MVVCGVCVCVCMSACTLVRFLACGGLGSGVWGGRGGGEEWGEVSRGTAGETPTLTSCCLKRVRQQPACLPACKFLPLSFSFGLTPPPTLPLLCPPADSTQLFQAFYSSPLPLCPLTPTKRILPRTCKTSMHALEVKSIHTCTFLLCTQ